MEQTPTNTPHQSHADFIVEGLGRPHEARGISVTQMFNGCGSLETIWATSFDYSAITSYASVLYGCNRLVGQTGYVPSSTAGRAALSFGSSGVLTDPANDQRTWVWAHLYDTGALEITGSSSPDANRTALASGRVCSNAHYLMGSAMPWYAQRASMTTCEFLSDVAVYITSMDYWFYSNTALTAVTGWANVDSLQSMRMTFNGCTGLASLSLAGLDPSSLTGLFYAFGTCGNLATIYVDPTWALPSSGVSGLSTFYNCTSLVGGNGTVYSSSNTGYAYMRIDESGTPGYLTAS